MQEPTLILASASPRRAQLLAQIGVPHRVMPAHIDERRDAAESIEDCVRRLSEEKALHVQRSLRAAAGGDCLVLGGRYHCGTRWSDAWQAARSTRGSCHACASRRSYARGVLGGGAGEHAERTLAAVAQSGATTPHRSRGSGALLASGEPCDKAGGYAIQGLGAIFVEELHGSYSGVMGTTVVRNSAAARRCRRAALEGLI